MLDFCSALWTRFSETLLTPFHDLLYAVLILSGFAVTWLMIAVYYLVVNRRQQRVLAEERQDRRRHAVLVPHDRRGGTDRRVNPHNGDFDG